jgi:TRAP transporter 4TM/12TM fusion protein
MSETAVPAPAAPELSRHRSLPRPWRLLVQALGLAGLLLAVNQVFNFKFGGLFVLLDNQYFYVLLGALVPLSFLIFPAGERAARDRVPWYDALLFAAMLAVCLFLAAQGRRVVDGGWEYQIPAGEWPTQWACYALWLLALEALRRAGGLVILLVVLAFSVYPIFAGSMPGPLASIAVPLPDAAAYHALSTESILGIPTQAFAGLVIGFLLFGAALQYTGAGEFFISLSFALLGHVRGGAAKVAIFASGLLGSMSGSVITNVLTTGSMTIPAMKRTGFRPAFAGGVETCASTGGVLMPPVMGATAFVMATFLNVPYVEVAIAATLPSLLYYFGLFMQIDARAAVAGMKGLPREELPKVGEAFRRGWYYIAVFVLLIWFLLVLKQEGFAAYYATALLILINQALPYSRWRLAELDKFLWGIATLFAEIATLLAGVGLIVGALSMTGLTGTFTNNLLYIAGDNVLVLLLMGAATSFILGMGMTVTACYIFLAVLLAPALVKVGLDPMAVHLFIMYWGMLSFITPPVALGAFAAASLAGSDPMRTGFEAMRLGSIIYVIPFFFVLNPALIMRGSLFDVVEVTIGALAGVTLIAAALQNYLIGIGRLDAVPALRWPISALFVIGGLLLAAPGGQLIGASNLELAVAGLAVALPGVALAWYANRKPRRALA